jgi:uncharacterized repeat protein (TIGR04138 family)
MTPYDPKLADVVQRDPRYAYEAYEFVFAALAYTQRALGRALRESKGNEESKAHHVSGRELLQGICDFAQREYGLMARLVFRFWGINRTDDFGEIVFTLVEAHLMSTTPDDNRGDFHDVFDLDKALVRGYRISLDEVI